MCARIGRNVCTEGARASRLPLSRMHARLTCAFDTASSNVSACRRTLRPPLLAARGKTLSDGQYLLLLSCPPQSAGGSAQIPAPALMALSPFLDQTSPARPRPGTHSLTRLKESLLSPSLLVCSSLPLLGSSVADSHFVPIRIYDIKAGWFPAARKARLPPSSPSGKPLFAWYIALCCARPCM